MDVQGPDVEGEPENKLELEQADSVISTGSAVNPINDPEDDGSTWYLNRLLRKTMHLWTGKSEEESSLLSELFVDREGKVAEFDALACKVLVYWFGYDLVRQDPSNIGGSKATFSDADDLWRQRWFAKKQQMKVVDEYLRDTYGEVLERAGEGEYDSWLESPIGTLALVIILDQMSRNIYRNNAKSWSFDSKALGIVRDCIDKGIDKKLPMFFRIQFYLPLVHAEDIKCQKLSMEVYADMLDKSEAAYRIVFERFVKIAKRHYNVVELFGRFPERNKYLGRTNTASEISYLSVE